jgi:hypothetical protein
MSGLLTGTAFTNQFPEINTTTGNGSDSLQGLVVAIYEIGCFAGSLFCLFAGEKLGRKNCIWRLDDRSGAADDSVRHPTDDRWENRRWRRKRNEYIYHCV